MRDFVAFVRQHLPRRDTPLDRYDEVVDELAAALEAGQGTLVQRGASDEEAWQDVLAQVPSWSSLARELTAVAGHGDPAGSLLRVSRLRRFLTIEGWTRDLIYATRVLRKDRGFAATAVLTLAVCLGGHAAIAAAVNGMLFHPLRVPEPDRVLLMANQYPRVEARRSLRSSTPDYDDRLRHVTLFDEQALCNVLPRRSTWRRADANVRHGGDAVAVPSVARILRMGASSRTRRQWPAAMTASSSPMDWRELLPRIQRPSAARSDHRTRMHHRRDSPRGFSSGDPGRY